MTQPLFGGVVPFMHGFLKRKIASILTMTGAGIGVFGAISMAIRLKIVLSPEQQQVLFYKGLFAGAAVLLVLGAIFGRQGRIEEEEDAANQLSSRPSDSLTSSSDDALPPGRYSTSERESPERLYEQRDRESQ